MAPASSHNPDSNPTDSDSGVRRGRDASAAERLLSRRAPAAAAETEAGPATPPADLHHRDTTTDQWSFLNDFDNPN